MKKQRVAAIGFVPDTFDHHRLRSGSPKKSLAKRRIAARFGPQESARGRRRGRTDVASSLDRTLPAVPGVKRTLLLDLGRRSPLDSGGSSADRGFSGDRRFGGDGARDGAGAARRATRTLEGDRGGEPRRELRQMQRRVPVHRVSECDDSHRRQVLSV